MCEFDIPIAILMISSGKGVYNKNEQTPDGIKIKEYSIRTEFFKTKWLKNFVRDNLNGRFNLRLIQQHLENDNSSERSPCQE